jgi:GAF domain-containing protein
MADGASAMIVKGDQLHAEATTGLLIALTRDGRATWPMDRHSASGQAILDRRVVQIETFGERELQQYRNSAFVVEDYGVRATIAAPLLRGGDALGALAFARMVDEPFTPKQVALIETFADQAVIAIENARLFNQLQSRNRQISESLRREEAASEILRQISRSPEQLDETLQAIANAASRLTGMSANLSLLEGEFRVIRGHARVDSVPPFRMG